MKGTRLVLLSVIALAAVAIFIGCSTSNSPTAFSSPQSSPKGTAPLGGAGPANVYDYSIVDCISQAPDGDQFVMNGTGTVEIQPATITGGGTYQILDASGNVTASGTWAAGKLYGFVVYGPVSAGSNVYGGRMQASIDLTGQSGEIILGATSAVGTHVPASAVTGATVKYHGEQFFTVISGSVTYTLE